MSQNWVGQLISNWFRPRQVGGSWFYSLFGNGGVWKKLDYLSNFEEIPELNAIINFKARAFSSGKIKLLDKNGKEIEKHWTLDLLKKPNWFQAQKEFLSQTKLFHEIYGDEYLSAFFGVGLKVEKTKALFTLPPNLVTVEYTNETPFFQHAERPTTGIKYTYKLAGKETDLPLETIIHLNDNRVNITNENKKEFLNGESKQKALKPALNNIRMAYETRGVILKRRGAMGILSNDGTDVAGQIPLEKGERDAVQQQYRDYGGLEGQDNIIITNAKLRWQSMAVAPDKLGLFQETQEDFFRMCDAYGTPQELFANIKGTTFENQNQAEKRCYDNTIVPEANEWIGALQQFFFGDDPSLQLVMDYSHLGIYQEDLELNGRTLGVLVEALSQAFADGAITIVEYQQELNKIGLAVGNIKPQ